MPTATSDLATGDCFVSATSIEIGLSDIEVVSCSDNWDYKVLDTFAVDRTGEYPGADYFDQLVAERCSSNADWYRSPLPESWRLGDRTIRCLQPGGQGSSQPATQNRCISLPTTAYSGSVRNTNLASQAETTAILHQTDCSITGNLTILPPLFGTGLLTGTIEGDKISFTIPASGNDVGVDLYFQGSIEDAGMFGTYNVPARQQNGEWELRPRTN